MYYIIIYEQSALRDTLLRGPKDMNDCTIRLRYWRNKSVMKPLGQQEGDRYGLDVKEIRQSFCNYFNNYGQVPCQNKFISQVYKSSTI